jgi:hypothetical protein
LPAHDSTHTKTTNAATTSPAMTVRRVSGEIEMLRVRWTVAVMSLPLVPRRQDEPPDATQAPGDRIMPSHDP